MHHGLKMIHHHHHHLDHQQGEGVVQLAPQQEVVVEELVPFLGGHQGVGEEVVLWMVEVGVALHGLVGVEAG